MATVILPTRTDLAVYTTEIDLDGETFIFDFQFNARDGFWYFDLSDALGVPIRSGVKVVTGFSLTRLIRDIRRPPGEMLTVDPTDRDREAGLEDLGEEILLTYVEEADVEAAGA